RVEADDDDRDGAAQSSGRHIEHRPASSRRYDAARRPDECTRAGDAAVVHAIGAVRAVLPGEALVGTLFFDAGERRRALRVVQARCARARVAIRCAVRGRQHSVHELGGFRAGAAGALLSADAIAIGRALVTTNEIDGADLSQWAIAVEGAMLQIG